MRPCRHRLRCGSCLAGGAWSTSSKRHPSPWLAKLVVRTWIEEQRSLLRLPAMRRGEEVPEDVLPKHRRLDEATVLPEHDEGERSSKISSLPRRGRRHKGQTGTL